MNVIGLFFKKTDPVMITIYEVDVKSFIQIIKIKTTMRLINGNIRHIREWFSNPPKKQVLARYKL